MKFMAVSALFLAARQAASFGISIPRHSSLAHVIFSPKLYMLSQSNDGSFTSTSSTSSNHNAAALDAHDGEALQHLFHKHCDKDGLMTKNMLMRVPAIQELLVCIYCCYCSA